LPVGQTLPEVCEHVLVGRVPFGGGCGSAAQCAPGARGDTLCLSQTEGEEAVCTPPQRLGEPCVQTCTSTAPNLVTCPNCPWGSPLRLCQSSSGIDGAGIGGAGVGGACFTNQGLYCAPSGVCTSLPSPGEACPDGVCPSGSACVEGMCGSSVGRSCLSFDCASGDAYCGQSQLCTPRLEDGSPCASLDECKSGRCLFGRCTRSLVGESLCLGQVAL